MMPINPQFRYRAARSFAWACRFKGLQLARTTFRSIDSPTIVSRSFFGYQLFLDVARSDAQRMLYLEGERFIAEHNLLRELLKPGDSVIDVGANIGYYLLMFERLIGGEGHIFCFEPEPDNLSELKRNIVNNHLNNVTLFEAAVGDKCGTTHLSRGLNGIVCEDQEGAIEVDLVSLDSAIEQRLDVIKVDVEGYEGQVLKGAQGLINKFHPSLFIEVHPFLLAEPYTTRDILDFAEESYADIRFYDSAVNGLLGKVSSRYSSRHSVNEIKDRAELLDRSAVFWMVCK